MSAAPAPPAAPGPLRRNALVAVAAVLTLATLGLVLRNQLVWDDTYLVSSLQTGGGLGRLADVVGSPFWSNSTYYASELVDYWRPLTSALLWLGATATGKAPWGMHLLSLVAAVGAALALAGVLRRVLAGAGTAPPRAALWLALLFAAHPLCAEVLCLVANVADHLALAFLALQLGALHDCAAGRGGARRLLAAAAFGFLACCSKEIGIVSALAPLAAWLLAAAADGSIGRRALLRVGPWAVALAPVAVYLALRAAVLAAAGAGANPLADSRLEAAAIALGFGQALASAIAPIPTGTRITTGLGDPAAVAAAIAAWLVLAGALATGIARRRRLPVAAVGLLVALALLAPSLAATAREGDLFPIATRYFHLPLAGLLIAIVPLVARRWGRAVEAALAVAVVLLALLSWARIGEWRTEVSFFAAELAHRPGSEEARVNLAQTLCKEDRFAEAERVLAPLAAPGARFSRPIYEATYLNAVAKIALLRDGDAAAASRALERALAIAPDDLTNVLALAEARYRAGRVDQAIAILEKAARAPWFRDHRRAAIDDYLSFYRKRARPAR